ncbi:TPA: hypothetical protein ACH3X1_003151 [Trebouxia sp. C0004]
MQQAMVSSIKAQQYADALSIADQILKLKPNDIIVQELRMTLAEKLSLDENVEVDDSGDEESSSNTESSSDQEQTSDSEDDAATASESGSDLQDLVAVHPDIPVCDVLHVTADHKALSVQQRKQLRTALKEQLEDLKIEQAAQQMHILGL